MGFFDAFKEPSKNDLEKIELFISSAKYYQGDISKYLDKFGVINNRYIIETYKENDMVVYKYQSFNIKNYRFDKETKNQDDKNAIKIVAGNLTSMFTLGYIPKEFNVKFAELLKTNKIYNVNLKILGGDYKIIAANDTQLMNKDYTVILDILVKK